MKMIIDCDTGIDDSIAILFALKHPEIRVMGITTGFGNCSAEQAAENSIRLVKLANPGYTVPVAIGAKGPLVGEWEGPVPHIHGPNGIGGVELAASEQVPSELAADELILKLVRENPGEITIVTLGRMTNLYHALQKEPALPRMVERVVSMGGSVFASGNATPTSEANIIGDPEAADAVLMAGFEMTLVGLDVTMKTHLHRSQLDIMLEKYVEEENRPIVEYMREALTFYYNFNRRADNYLDYCPVHDPLAVLCAVNPVDFTFKRLRCRVELEGRYTRGMIVHGCRQHPLPEAPFTWVCTDVNGDDAIQAILAVFTAE